MTDLEALPSHSMIPSGASLALKLCRKDLGLREHRIFVLLITFIAYACFHASRKPLSIVKSVLDPEVLQIVTATPPSSFTPLPSASPLPLGWPPFNGDLGKARLGEIDVAFLASYALGMYYAGALGDRLDLRKFLTFGMVSSGACVCAFGLGFWWDIHSFWYYFTVQIITGFLSAIGWPVVVAVVANWSTKAKRGLIMGIWNAHASVGNIAGSIVGASALRFGWGWSFVFPGMALMLCSLLVFFFLIVEPEIIGLQTCHEDKEQTLFCDDERKLLLPVIQLKPETSEIRLDAPCHNGSNLPILVGTEWRMNGFPEKSEELKITEGHSRVSLVGGTENVPIHLFEAWNIPGVALYAFCLFFVKLVAYTFLFWLPFYIRHTEIAGVYLSDKMAGYLSTIFDIGGVVGGIVAGHLSDKYNAKAMVAVILIYCAIPVIYLFRSYGGASLTHAIVLMIVCGVFVNGPYALITTAVSADLGTHDSLRGNARALATVSAIIDGTGSVGAAIGPLLTGYIAARSWTAVFMMLSISLLIAGLFLTKLVVTEMKEKADLQGGVAKMDTLQQELREIGH